METTGMTHGGQGEHSSDLEMMGGSLEVPDLKNETESMEEEQDTEV